MTSLPPKRFPTPLKINKKVLLRERKRHTTRHVASTHYAGLVGGGTLGTPPAWIWVGVPGVPPHQMDGVPPTWTWVGGTQGTPNTRWMGYPPPPGPGWGVPWIPPSAGWGTPHHQLDGVPPHHQLDGVTPTISWMGYPPPSAGWGTPHHQLDGVPAPSAGWDTPHQLDGVPPPTISWMGYPPPPPSAGWGTPPPPHQLDGVPSWV